MARRIMAIRPAAGPDTLTCDLLKTPTTIPPITPVMIPANGGAPLATDIPRQSGSATKKTTIPDNASALISVKIVFIYN